MRFLTLLLVFAALSGCGVTARVGELFLAGGEATLREPLRPIRGTTRVLVLALDGVGDGVLREALAAGEMPRLAELLGAPVGENLWANAYAAPGVMSVLPAETSGGWAAVFTGEPPARSGVPGNEWFDRSTLTAYAPVPLSVTAVQQTLGIYTDDLFGRAIATPTLFERAGVRSHVALGFVHRGADVLSTPDPSDIGDVLKTAFHFVAGSTGAVYSTLDDDTVAGVRRAFRRHGVPDLQVAYLPGVDLVAHDEGPAAQRAYLADRVDGSIGEILDAYRERDLLDDTYVVVVADHGHSESLADDAHSLGGDGDADEPVAVLEAAGRRVRPFGVGVDSTTYDAAMVYNEAFAHVFLTDPAGCPPPGGTGAGAGPCDWQRPARLDGDVLPVVRAFDAANRDTASAMHRTLDLVLARVSDPSGQTSPRFEVYQNGRLVPVAEYLAATPRPDLLAFERRLGWLVDGPLGARAGDVLLMARDGTEAAPDGTVVDIPENRYYFGSPRRSGHGSATARDGLIPLVLAHPQRFGTTLRARMTGAVGPAPTQLDVTGLILALLEE